MKFKLAAQNGVSAMWCGNVALGAPFGGPESVEEREKMLGEKSEKGVGK